MRVNDQYEALLRSEVSPELSKNVDSLRRVFHAEINSDAQFRSFMAADTPVCLVYIEGMASDEKIGQFILHACDPDAEGIKGPVDAETLKRRFIEIAQCETEHRMNEIVRSVVTGMTAMLIDGCAEALIMETRGYPARKVDRTTNESVVIGPQEGFVESMRTNLTLVRRYVPSPHLVSEALTAGRDIPINLSLVYLKGVADDRVVDGLRRRIKRIDAPVVRGIGELQQLIEDRPFALLPQMLETERPDRVAACLMDGQAAILADNSPYALVAPVTVFHQLHASDDTFSRWQYGTFVRLIRVVGMLISVFLPGLYVALTNHHVHLIPMNLLTSIAESRANVPFPVLAEVLMMEFSFYLINEAGTRIPQQIGSALGIVGALILGQAAVSASIISPILIIIVALTGLGNYAVPDYSFGIALMLYRLFVIAAGALLGLYGICIAGFCVCLSVCGLRSLGFPYAAPVAPFRPHNPDILARLPLKLQRKRMFYARSDSWLGGARR